MISGVLRPRMTLHGERAAVKSVEEVEPYRKLSAEPLMAIAQHLLCTGIHQAVKGYLEKEEELSIRSPFSGEISSNDQA